MNYTIELIDNGFRVRYRKATAAAIDVKIALIQGTAGLWVDYHDHPANTDVYIIYGGFAGGQRDREYLINELKDILK